MYILTMFKKQRELFKWYLYDKKQTHQQIKIRSYKTKNTCKKFFTSV